MNQVTPIIRGKPLSVLERVRMLLPEIRDRADEVERGGRVPLDLLAKVEDAGAFRMCLPRSVGGEQLPYHEVAKIIEEVAGADASVAWHIMVAAGSQVFIARLPLASQREYYRAGPDVWPKCAVAPKGIATPVEGGYRLSGRWPLASGAREFEWLCMGFFIKDEDGIRKAPNGMPDLRVCLIPRGDADIIETWDAVGLRGTRSDDVAFSDRFVGEDWQASFMGPSQLDSPALAISMPWVTAPHHSSVVVGILNAAIDDLADVSLTRKPAFNPTALMKDDPVFRTRFGEISARVDAIGALAERSLAILAQCERDGRNVTPAEGARISGAEALIHHDGTALMDQIMMLSGSGGVYMSNPQQRRWRDLRCVAQHQAANIGSYANYASQMIVEATARSPRSSTVAPSTP